MKQIIVGIILYAVLVTLMLCFGEDLNNLLKNAYGQEPASIVYTLIVMATLGIIALIYWWATK